jgi:hypothetical protein
VPLDWQKPLLEWLKAPAKMEPGVDPPEGKRWSPEHIAGDCLFKK